MKWILKDKEGFQKYMQESGERIAHRVLSQDDVDHFVKAYYLNKHVIAVGDYTANIAKMEDAYIPMDISFTQTYVDGKTHNEPINQRIQCDYVIQNKAGEISTDAFYTISYAIQSTCISIYVNGEEDLLVLALVLFCNTGDYILYGDPFEKCTRFICVCPEIKAMVLSLMARFGEWKWEA